VTSADIVADVQAAGRNASHIADRTKAADMIAGIAQPGDRVVVMGARDDTLSLLAGDILAKIAES